MQFVRKVTDLLRPSLEKYISPVENGVNVEPLPLTGANSAFSIDEVLARKPEWVKRNISAKESKSIAAEIARSKAISAIEVGVASGFSSAILYAALGKNGDRPSLYSMDWSEECYFDRERKTGDAFFEIHGKNSNYSLTTSVHTGMISSAPMVDFVFIDANHQNPWPALDLLSLGRFVKPGATIALHDVEMIFHKWGRHASGARDLYRAWLGEKWRREGSSNVGYLRYDQNVMLKSLPAALMTDWDTKVGQQHISRFIAIAKQFPAQLGQPIIAALESRDASHKHMNLLPASEV